eukprot:c5052_g1_i3.p1 GENE.c5052_g1_i3~~c5052_g1_i3.p1  ORF type:complete len:261 (-),score=56.06 c5052_g1_i3:234-1016(-)
MIFDIYSVITNAKREGSILANEVAAKKILPNLKLALLDPHPTNVLCLRLLGVLVTMNGGVLQLMSDLSLLPGVIGIFETTPPAGNGQIWTQIGSLMLLQRIIKSNKVTVNKPFVVQLSRAVKHSIQLLHQDETDRDMLETVESVLDIFNTVLFGVCSVLDVVGAKSAITMFECVPALVSVMEHVLEPIRLKAIYGIQMMFQRNPLYVEQFITKPEVLTSFKNLLTLNHPDIQKWVLRIVKGLPADALSHSGLRAALQNLK